MERNRAGLQTLSSTKDGSFCSMGVLALARHTYAYESITPPHDVLTPRLSDCRQAQNLTPTMPSPRLTLTECIAEYTGRPLLSLTTGDIGTNERHAEERLSKWFKLAEKWGAVMLIDEADVYLERRSITDLHRNSLVSGKTPYLEPLTPRPHEKS